MPDSVQPAFSRPATPRATLAAATRLLNAAAADPAISDPLITLWRDWRRTAVAVNRSCRAAQVLERRLMTSIGAPRIEVPLKAQPVYASDAQTIDRLLGIAPATEPLRTRLKRELAEKLARWEREAEACGLSAAEAEEIAASRRAGEMLATAATTPARSVMGMIAKLAIAAEWGRLDPERDAQPWPFLHGALADLVTLSAVPRPSAAPEP